MNKDSIWQQIDARADLLWEIASSIHARPEPAFEEKHAAALLTDTLEAAGYHVRREIGQLETAFRGDHPSNAGKQGPTIALIAEYDALPNLGHACGHHLIAGAAVGAALGLVGAFHDISAKLVVLGTPGEENGGGKIKLLRAGAFEDIDVALMIHPGDETWSVREYLALLEFVVSYHGKAAHTVANAESGINALDALLLLFQGMHAARVGFGRDIWISGIVEEGGTAPNTVPETAIGRFQIRSRGNDHAVEVLERFRAIAQGCALATGADMELRELGEMYKTLVPNKALAEVFEMYARQLGFPCEPSPTGVASTDLGNVSWCLPVLHPHINVLGQERAALHSRQFVEKSTRPEARLAMLAAAKCLAAIAIDLGTEEELLTTVVREFSSRTDAAGPG